jgi:hypothetical protein
LLSLAKRIGLDLACWSFSPRPNSATMRLITEAASRELRNSRCRCCQAFTPLIDQPAIVVKAPARTLHAQVAADVCRLIHVTRMMAPTDGRVAQVPHELAGSGLCRFPLLLWRRGTGRGGRRSPSPCQIDWCRNPQECRPNHSIEHGASSPQPSPPREEREQNPPLSEIFGCLRRSGTPRPTQDRVGQHALPSAATPGRRIVRSAKYPG